jgi:hypothetical protein
MGKRLLLTESEEFAVTSLGMSILHFESLHPLSSRAPAYPPSLGERVFKE